MNRSQSNLSVGSIAASFLILLLCGIGFFSLLGVVRVQNYAAFCPVIVFASINMCIVFFLAFGSRFLLNSIPPASLISVWTVTVLYSVIQFVHLGFNYSTAAVNGYILFHLILLFLYFAIVLPAILIGARSRNR